VTPEQWAKVNGLFHAALERAADERRAWLMAETGADPEVMREVEALIDAHEREPSFLDEPAVLADPPLSGVSLTGKQIGAYVVSREIGRGGMGVVYLAHDTRLGRDVAIKALPRDLPADGRRRERLRREARAAAALAHPNIATIYALEEDGDELYLVSEYVRGSTLREELTQGPLPPARLVETAVEITRAIGAAHAEGIIHRDLKPDNVMRTAAGAIKILDFGLARAMSSWADEDLATLTRSGTLLGTPAYMAPEQIRGSRVDGRADIFAAGVTIYELATGVHPFDGGAIGLTLHRVLTEAPLTFAQRGVRAPAGLWDVVERCLRKDPDARYASAAELLADLGRIQITLSSPSAAAEAPTRLSMPSPPSPDGASPELWSGTDSRRVTPFGSRETETSPQSSEWWWQFHQLAVSVFLGALIYPAWRTWEWVPDSNDTLRAILRVGTLVVIIIDVSLRLHLWFLSRYDPQGLLDQRARSALVIRAADLGFALALLTGALQIMPRHPGTGALFLGLGIVYAVVFLAIEPATTRAAFRER
jgi:serine/threonine protein kinase